MSSHAMRPTVQAARTAEPPVIDGRLSEASWSSAPAADQFTQRDPEEGKPATERTEIRVLYDEVALYIGARLYDSRPAEIARRLSNRDDPPDADYIGIGLDPRHDHLTGAAFIVSAAGVQRDLIISNDTNEDSSWDAVWGSAVSIDNQGWSAELRVPFSQLRFNAGASQTWGINVTRYIRRKNEQVWLELVPKNENGLASRMIHLTGIDGIGPRRNVELAPYTAVRQEVVEREGLGDPFNDGSRTFASVGIDVKARVTGGLTLDATINPDFGQAEVDPAVVNLSAFETFFQEKRRFFIEGSEIFSNFGRRGSNINFGFNTSDPDIFYSRRIGRAPQGETEGDFVDRPRATSILGAAKLSGKTANGWSIGLIEALTGRERVRIVTGAVRSRTDVEPLTNYFVARLQRDLSRGGLGFLTTSVLRRMDTPLLRDQLAENAFVFGADAFYFFDRARDWVINGKLSGSRVSGTETAIAVLQRAPQRYFQRPDAPQVTFDPSRGSLSGYAGRVNLNRNGGVWRVSASLWTVSPGFESNDLGFHFTGDRWGGHAVLLWRKEKPDRFTRSRSAWIARANTWNFDSLSHGKLWFGCAGATFLNYWNLNGCVARFGRSYDDRLTRGGPVAIDPQGQGINAGLSSDGRKWISFRMNTGRDWNEYGGWSSNSGFTVDLKPRPSLTISTGPELNLSKSLAQYIRTDTDPAAEATFGERYVFAAIDQRQLTLVTRVNYILSPRASLQVYMQPLLATGDYGAFKALAAPRTYDFRALDPADPSIMPDNPDFNLKSLRLNAIFRWEFLPGSTLYAVWTEQREDTTNAGNFRFGRDARKLFTAPSDDVFLVKMTYWLGR
jgi:hypothetical protein